MTRRDALRYGRARLTALESAVTDETPELDAEVLLRHVLGISRADLYADPDRPITPDRRTAYEALLRRRAAGEPVAYLTSHREFMGLDFLVDRRVLIPRPETEALVERALELLPDGEPHLGQVQSAKCKVQSEGGCGSHRGCGLVAVDVGTGSGAIAISLAAYRPLLRVCAFDVSAGALEVARRNAERLLGEGQTRVTFVRAPLLDELNLPARVIAANLPYIPTPALATLPKGVRAFEPHLALDGGPDGLDCYRALLDALRARPDHLQPGGAILMECDPRQIAALSALARDALPGATMRAHRDLLGHERVVEVRPSAPSGAPGRSTLDRSAAAR
ncbi:MAG: peptide chain release factor N(5)-glutamine methyltransferase [Chloroflexi bacterium]|nr:peptide chain release factor N(5)-glutamine methyltransferase [Chloroflexota bacterium]